MFGGYEPEVDNSSDDEKAGHWQVGIGLQLVDGLTVSDDLHRLAGDNIRGLIGYDAVEQALIDNYRDKDLDNIDIRNAFEADLVATRIARLLSKDDFILSVATLKSIHRELFKGLEFLGRNLAPGVFKNQNWRKSEPVLYGDSVRYGSADSVEENLAEVVDEQRRVTYLLPFEKSDVEKLAAFCSRIWEIHPFSEGNTRTVAVYIEKYLRKMGLRVDNEAFEAHSAYFRDALVRSCYMNAGRGVQRTPRFLERFFENLLLGTKYHLTHKELYARELDFEPPRHDT
jgi:fido (protein-threonine AMPylation protein)